VTVSRIGATLAMLAWSLGGCAAATAGPTGVSEVTVGPGPQSAAAPFCADFALTARQAAEAIRASRVIGAQAYAQSDHLACSVSGTAMIDGAPATWRFDAGGTGTITRTGGDTVYLDCARCRAGFGATGK
jgi:hypothetical protein